MPEGPEPDLVELSPLDQLVELVVMNDYAIMGLDVDGRVATWSAGAKRINGYRADEIIGRHFSVFYPSEDLAAGIPDAELTAATADGSFETEGWRVRQDGSTFWANVVITAIYDEAHQRRGFARVTRDITERKRLEGLAGHLGAVVESSADAIISKRIDGTIVSWNPGAESLYGYCEAEAVGKPISLLVPEGRTRRGGATVGPRRPRGVGRALRHGTPLQGWLVHRCLVDPLCGTRRNRAGHGRFDGRAGYHRAEAQRGAAG